MRDLQDGNQVVAGQWFADGPGVAEASVEQGLARTLRLKLGDMMRFDIAGTVVDAKVTSLRKLEWGSMRANFFVIINPAAMAATPQTMMTAFHIAPGGKDANIANTLTRAYPNLTVIDVSGIIRQLQDVLDQVVMAVEFLFLFTLASGVLVLYAALMGSQAERTRESALLRALGATRQQLGDLAADRVRHGGRAGGAAGRHGRRSAGVGAGDVPVQVSVGVRAGRVAGRAGGRRALRADRRVVRVAAGAAAGAVADVAGGVTTLACWRAGVHGRQRLASHFAIIPYDHSHPVRHHRRRPAPA